MPLTPIETSLLRLNPHNDRHGALRDEASAIQWLLENRTAHMRALAKDLSATKKLFEYPLVHLNGSEHIVFDGNRRVCCIKLLRNPKLCPSEKWVEFFIDLGTEDVKKAFEIIECETEAEIEIIDEKLFRRHTGSQDGVGQSPWDAEGKANFLARTGKENIGIGQSIEIELKNAGLISAETDLPWSNLQRLFSSEPIRKRAGISFTGGQLSYLRDKSPILATLEKIAADLVSGDVVLDDLWNNEKKGQYLDRLKSHGAAIDLDNNRSPILATLEPNIEIKPSKTSTKGKPYKQKNLISSADQNPFVKYPSLNRSEQIWRELQFNLEFDRHNNAIAVLMRVLLELSITHYMRSHKIQAAETLAGRVAAVSDSMLNRQLIDGKARSIIRKFEKEKPIVSAHSMHQYVHNANFHPAKSDLNAIWHVIRVIIVNSVE